MSTEETPAQKAAREEKEREEELKRQQKEAEMNAEIDADLDSLNNLNNNNNNSNSNNNNNNNSNNNNGMGGLDNGRRHSKSRNEKNGMSDLEDNMDGLVPTDRGNVTGRKRSFVSTNNQVHQLTQRFIDKEISEENYILALNMLKGENGGNGSKTSKGSKARRGNGKRSSAVCCPFFLCFYIYAWVVVCRMFLFFLKNFAFLRTFFSFFREGLLRRFA